MKDRDSKKHQQWFYTDRNESLCLACYREAIFLLLYKNEETDRGSYTNSVNEMANTLKEKTIIYMLIPPHMKYMNSMTHHSDIFQYMIS